MLASAHDDAGKAFPGASYLTASPLAELRPHHDAAALPSIFPHHGLAFVALRHSSPAAGGTWGLRCCSQLFSQVRELLSHGAPNGDGGEGGGTGKDDEPMAHHALQ